MTTYQLQQNEFTISTDPGLLDFEMIYDFIVHESYWGEDMTRERLQKQILATSLNFGVYHNQRQIGFAQVLTNFVTFAYLGNVFITEAYRGQGLSKWLMQAISGHPELQGIRRWLLHTRDAQGLYSQFGFKVISKPEEFMERFLYE
jgi:N-acetylglutamate synthase-like GNAT family acetyltransferase